MPSAKPTLPAFDPADVPESNATTIPGALRAQNQTRYNRRLGDHAGLRNFGVNLTRIVAGGQSSYRHAHSTQDEFIWVLGGEVVLETDAGSQVLKAAPASLPGPGMRTASSTAPTRTCCCWSSATAAPMTSSPTPRSTCMAVSAPTANSSSPARMARPIESAAGGRVRRAA